MLNRLLLVAGGGATFAPPPGGGGVDTVKATSVKRTSNLTTPFDYYDSGESGFSNNGVIEFDEQEDMGAAEADLWVIGDPTKLGPIPAEYNGLLATFQGDAIWQDDITSYAELKIFRNSNLLQPIWVAQITPNAFNTAPEFSTRPILLTTGDYFELCARSGDSGTALYAENYSLTFSIMVWGA